MVIGQAFERATMRNEYSWSARSVTQIIFISFTLISVGGVIIVEVRMNTSLDYLITPTDDHHHAEWIIENRLAVGRREPSRPGATDGRFEIHFVSAMIILDTRRCSNLHLIYSGSRWQPKHASLHHYL